MSSISTAIKFSLAMVCLAASNAAAQTDNNMATPAISYGTASLEGHQLHYAQAGDDRKPGILFLHGTPGSWQAFESYLSDQSLQATYFMLSVDRPGWGKSTIDPASEIKTQAAQHKVPTFSLQARAIMALMQRYPAKKWLLVGHSLGASLAPKIVLLDEQRVAGMLLMAGTLDPELGKPRWYNRAASAPPVRWLLPGVMKYANDEIMVLRHELQVLEVELDGRQLATKVVVMQGMKDKLVSPKNTDYIKRNWPAVFKNLQVIELPNAGHFLLWKQPDLVNEAIRQFEF